MKNLQNLRVYNFINPPCKPDYYNVESVKEAIELINNLANAQLKNDDVFCNVFGLEVFEDGEWSDWHNEDGEDIDEVIKNL